MANTTLGPSPLAAAWTAGLCLAAALLLAPARAVEAAPASAPPMPAGDPVRGQKLYQARCGACHSLDANRVGPSHRGVFGRRAASAPGYRYSPALKSLNVVWTAPNLDRWLQDPTRMAPGTAMGIRVTAPQDRADLIVYLKAQGK